MAWAGYFTYGGVEIVNATRTETYARNAGLGWFHPVYRNEALPLILGETYTSPLIDDAPWTDPDILNSYDFYGVYPLTVTGIENSTITASIVESTRDGGVVQGARRATKTIVYSAVLVGASECAVEHGMRWLTTILNRCGCLSPRHGGPVCGGQDLTFLSCEPAVDLNYTVGVQVTERIPVDGLFPVEQSDNPVNGGTPSRPGGQLVNGGTPDITKTSATETLPTFDLTECLDEYHRTMHKVTCTTGPTITAKSKLSNGGEAWTIEWTVVAGDPSRYAAPNPLVQGFLDPTVPVPYKDGFVPSGGIWDDTGFVTTDPPCAVTVFGPVFDPTCELLVAPPAVPTVNPVCFDFPHNYRRRMITLPKQEIAYFWATVPVVTIHTTDEVRNLRIRFFEDDDNDGDIDDPCNPEGDVVFTYLPSNSVVTFDGVARQIYVDTPGMNRRRADSVATDTDGGPFTWPELSCGCAYVVTVDMEQTQVVPTLDLTLVKKAC